MLKIITYFLMIFSFSIIGMDQTYKIVYNHLKIFSFPIIGMDQTSKIVDNQNKRSPLYFIDQEKYPWAPIIPSENMSEETWRNLLYNFYTEVDFKTYENLLNQENKKTYDILSKKNQIIIISSLLTKYGNICDSVDINKISFEDYEKCSNCFRLNNELFTIKDYCIYILTSSLEKQIILSRFQTQFILESLNGNDLKRISEKNNFDFEKYLKTKD